LGGPVTSCSKTLPSETLSSVIKWVMTCSYHM
jgi:hypothetical protein